MMKYLLVTGELAKDYVRKYALEAGIDFDLLVIPFPVAALLTPKMIIRYLRKLDLTKYDMILLPGLIRGSSKEVEEVVGIPTYKGSKDAADLPLVIEYIKRGGRLSHEIPACELIKLDRYKSFENDYNKYLSIGLYNLGREPYIRLRNLYISKVLPIRIAAEIIDAPKLSKNELARRVKYYVNSGADIIDIGMIAGEDNSKKIGDIVRVVRSVTDAPLSIDTLNVNEIEEAVKHGVDMIVSLDKSSIIELHDIVKDKVCVLIPFDYKENYFPEDPYERVKAMEECVETALKYGVKNILCDLIVNPLNSPSLIDSLVSFYTFTRRRPGIQLFMGIGNVTELLDADSPGVNALLVGLAYELGVSIILTTEASDKTRGCIKEVSKAVKMMYVAKMKKVFPKNLGLDMLFFKEKKAYRFKYDLDLCSNIVDISRRTRSKITVDRCGFFKIWIDWDNNRICVMHYSLKTPNKCDIAICGEKAEDICQEIIARGLISEPTHIAYLARELEKAEIALKTGRSYIQDQEVF